MRYQETVIQRLNRERAEKEQIINLQKENKRRKLHMVAKTTVIGLCVSIAFAFVVPKAIDNMYNDQYENQLKYLEQTETDLRVQEMDGIVIPN